MLVSISRPSTSNDCGNSFRFLRACQHLREAAVTVGGRASERRRGTGDNQQLGDIGPGHQCRMSHLKHSNDERDAEYNHSLQSREGASGHGSHPVRHGAQRLRSGAGVRAARERGLLKRRFVSCAERTMQLRPPWALAHEEENLRRHALTGPAPGVSALRVSQDHSRLPPIVRLVPPAPQPQSDLPMVSPDPSRHSWLVPSPINSSGVQSTGAS